VIPRLSQDRLGWTDAFAAAPDHQRQEIGRRDVARAVEEARRAGSSGRMSTSTPTRALPHQVIGRWFQAWNGDLVAQGNKLEVLLTLAAKPEHDELKEPADGKVDQRPELAPCSVPSHLANGSDDGLTG
jgi:hypothetical protein